MKMYALLTILCISTAVLPTFNAEHFLTTNDPDYVLDALTAQEKQKNNREYMLLYSLRNQAARLTDNDIFSLAELLKSQNTSTPTTAYYNTLIKQQEFQTLQEKVYQLSGKKNVVDRALNATKTTYERTAIIALILETLMNTLLTTDEQEVARTAAQRLAHFEKELNKLTSSEAVNDAVMALDLDPANIIGYLKKLAETTPQTHTAAQKKESTTPAPATPAVNTASESSNKQEQSSLSEKLPNSIPFFTVHKAVDIQHFLTTNDNDPDYVLDYLESLEKQKDAAQYITLYILRNLASDLTNHEILSVEELVKLKRSTFAPANYYTTHIQQKEFQALQKKIEQLIGNKNTLKSILTTAATTEWERATFIALFLDIIITILSHSEEELSLTAQQQLATFKTKLNDTLGSLSATNDAFKALSLDQNNAIGYLTQLSAKTQSKVETTKPPVTTQKKESSIPAKAQEHKKPAPVEQELSDEELEELVKTFSSFKK